MYVGRQLVSNIREEETRNPEDVVVERSPCCGGSERVIWMFETMGSMKQNLMGSINLETRHLFLGLLIPPLSSPPCGFR